MEQLGSGGGLSTLSPSVQSQASTSSSRREERQRLTPDVHSQARWQTWSVADDASLADWAVQLGAVAASPAADGALRLSPRRRSISFPSLKIPDLIEVKHGVGSVI